MLEVAVVKNNQYSFLRSIKFIDAEIPALPGGDCTTRYFANGDSGGHCMVK